LRKVFTILLALPMLLPPGFCLCRLGGDCRPQGQPGDEPTAVARKPMAAASCGCRNPRCQHRRTDSDPTQKPRENPTGKVPNPTPQQDHAPGCPALPSYAVSRAITLDPLSQLADLPSCGPAVTWLSLNGPVAEGKSPAAFAVLPAPIFLIYCDFRC
jgi:hypothetical protein